MKTYSSLYSIVIPARNEAENLPDTVNGLHSRMMDAGIPYEIVLVNDHGTDDTASTIERLARSGVSIIECPNPNPPGFGNAVRHGFEKAAGEVVAVVMADGSEDPADVSLFYRKIIDEGFDCCFGSRWAQAGLVSGYPPLKLLINRLANLGIMLLFGIRYNDVTNAFKAYRRDVIQGCRPFLSKHFNLTVELPLKAIIRGYSYTVAPNKWRRRKHGASHLRLEEMGSRYLFIVLYCLLEKWLSRGDYHRRNQIRSA